MPYKTFGTFLDHLRAIGVPSHIDKSVMTHLSGGMQSWLKAALRYMKLVNPDDIPTDQLEALVKAQGDDRKDLLRDLFNSTYTFATSKIDLKNTTPVKLRQIIIDAGAQGETVEKIIAFMIAMAKDAGVPLSPLLTKRAVGPRRQKAKPATRQNRQTEEPEDDDTEDSTPSASAMKTIILPGAKGHLTLGGTFNIFDLAGDERDLVFSIIDKMKAFEAAHPAPDESEEVDE
jgi:hypothetical protein